MGRRTATGPDAALMDPADAVPGHGTLLQSSQVTSISWDDMASNT